MRDIILAFLGSLCPAVLFNVDRRKFVWIGLAGSAGWLIYTWIMENTDQVIFATFVGAVAVGLSSEVMARVLKSPTTVFSVSGIFPLVPGIGAYNTVRLVVENRLNDAAGKAIETIASAGCIALGIMLMSAVFRTISKVKKRRTATQ